MDDAAEAIHPLALLDETGTRGTRGRASEAGGGKADDHESGTTEFADISELTDGVGLCVNRDAVGATGGAEAVLANGKNLAAAEQNGDVNVIQFGLLGIAALVGIDVSIQCL